MEVQSFASIKIIWGGLTSTLLHCCRYSITKKTKRIPGKAGLRFYKNVGLGFKTPKEAIEGGPLSRIWDLGVWGVKNRRESARNSLVSRDSWSNMSAL